MTRRAPLFPFPSSKTTVARPDAAPLRLEPAVVLRHALRLVLVLAALSAAVNVVAFTQPQLVGHGFLASVHRALSLDQEHNIPSFLSVLMLLAGSLLMLLTARLLRGAPFARHWLVLGGVFAVMALDEGIGMHETLMPFLSGALGTGGVLHFSWVVLGIPFALLMGLAYFRLWWRLPRSVRFLTFAAAGWYLGGALGMEMVDGLYASRYGEDNLGYQLLTTVEELFEMIGLSVLLYALLRYLRQLTAGLDLRVSFGSRPD